MSKIKYYAPWFITKERTDVFWLHTPDSSSAATSHVFCMRKHIWIWLVSFFAKSTVGKHAHFFLFFSFFFSLLFSFPPLFFCIYLYGKGVFFSFSSSPFCFYPLPVCLLFYFIIYQNLLSQFFIDGHLGSYNFH